MRRYGQTGFHRFLRHQTGRQQDAGVTGIGARGNRSNQNIAIFDFDTATGLLNSELKVFLT